MSACNVDEFVYANEYGCIYHTITFDAFAPATLVRIFSDTIKNPNCNFIALSVPIQNRVNPFWWLSLVYHRQAVNLNANTILRYPIGIKLVWVFRVSVVLSCFFMHSVNLVGLGSWFTTGSNVDGTHGVVCSGNAHVCNSMTALISHGGKWHHVFHSSGFNELIGPGLCGSNFKNVIYERHCWKLSSWASLVGWSLVNQNISSDQSTLVEVMAWCCRATSH